MRTRKMLAIVGCAAMVLGLLAIAPASQAHTNVKDSAPQDGSTVDVLPEEVWVQFGDETLPAQPMAISDGHLEVFDACGNRVDEGDTAMSQSSDRLTVNAVGGQDGRYEIHWFATAVDGAAQAGVIDFIVGSPAPCKKVKVADEADDTDLGFDVVKLVTQASAKESKIRLRLATRPTCATVDDYELSVIADSDFDGVDDLVGDYECVKGKIRLVMREADAADDTEVLASFPVKLKWKILRVKIPSGALPDASSLDIHVESYADSDDCDAETRCFDRAPELGSIRIR